MSESVTLPIVVPLAALIPVVLLAFSYGKLANRVEELARGLARLENALYSRRAWDGEERRSTAQ